MSFTRPPRNSHAYDLNPEFSAKLVDREGNIWLATRGIHRFFYSPLVRQELPGTATGLGFFAVAPADDGPYGITAGDRRPTNLCYVAGGRVTLQKSPGDLSGFAYRKFRQDLWAGEMAGSGVWLMAI